MTTDNGDLGEDTNKSDASVSEQQIDEHIQSQATLNSLRTSEYAKIESDEEEAIVDRQRRQKHRKRTILHDSDEESSSQNGSIQSSHCMLPKNSDTDIRQDEMDERERLIDDHLVGPETERSANHREPFLSCTAAGDRPLERSTLNDDVFDAEQDSDAADAANSGDEDQGEDESNEGEMSAALKRRLAKGASKKARSSRAGGHSKRDDVNDIHRETQRIVRESSLHLPYHKPPKLDLSVFLSRTEQKQKLMASIASKTTTTHRLKPLPKDMEAFNNIISTTQTLNERSAVPSTDEINCVKTNVSSQLNVLPLTEVENPDTGHAEFTMKAPSVLVLETVSTSHLFLDDDELPDLIVETEERNSISEQLEAERLLNREGEALNGCLGSDAQDETTRLISEEVVNPNIVTQITVCTSDLVLSLSGSNTSLNVDPTVTNSCTSLVNVGTPKTKVDAHTEVTGVPTVSNGIPAISETGKYSECGPLSGTSTFRKASVVSGDVLPCLVKPMLSSDSFIDLDEEEEGNQKLDVGMNSLMERMLKHSRTNVIKKPKHIEITTVSKDTVDAGRQELKLEKMVYSVDDGDDEPMDPLMNTPGAKLTLLREKLRASMKVKREESMQKRYEMFEQEYGGSYKERRMEEEAKEEAELTDQTDTDDEEEEEEEEDDEQDIDEMEEDEEEKAVKRNINIFVDEEADDDEEDEDYNGSDEGDDEADDVSDKADDEESAMGADKCNTDDSLSLNLDTEDAVDDGGTTDGKARVSSSGQCSLKKTKTMDLFDEDANTEAEGMSQKSDAAETEFEKRAFEEVSSTCLLKIKGNEKDILGYPAGIRLLDPMEADQKDDTTMSSMSQLRDNSMASADSSFDMMSSLLPAGQRSMRQQTTTQMLQVRATPELCTPTCGSVTSASGGQMNSRELASQAEVRAMNSTPVTGKGTSSPDGDIFLDDDLHLHLEEDSQMNQADEKWQLEGKSYLGAAGTQPRRHLVMGDGSLPVGGSSRAAWSSEGVSQDNNMDELLGLCSGNFSSLAASCENSSGFNPVSTMTQSDTNMDELIGLCSGQFTSLSSPRHAGNTYSQTVHSSIVQSSFASNNIFKDGALSNTFTFDDSPIKKKPSKKRKLAISDDEEDDDVVPEDKNDDSFEAVSYGDEDQKMSDVEFFALGGAPLIRLYCKRRFINPNADDDRESEGEKQKRFKGFVVKGKHGKIRKEFVEDEAELSGSEFESDEDLDLDEKDDFLEQEAGDQDDIGTEEELRDQVHRVHLKTMIDQDAREIRLLQEQYLPDGDLQSDGTGRMRRFRWKNADDDSQNELGGNMEDEQAEEEGENEARWRTERLEREKFLEQRQEEVETTSQASRLLKLGRVVFQRKSSEMSTPSPVSLTPKTPLLLENVKTPVGLFKVPGQGHGSFLSRSKTALAKLAETTKVSSKANPTRNSRNFVFSTISSPEHKEKMAVQALNHATPTSARPPPKKRTCPEKRNSLPANSIFMLFDKAN